VTLAGQVRSRFSDLIRGGNPINGPYGTRSRSGDVVIVVGGTQEGHERRFESVEFVTETDCGYCMPYENGNSVFVLRKPLRPVAEAWPELKHYD